jgi:hypothetical protein
MKTLTARPIPVRIIVQPPDGLVAPFVSRERLSSAEASQIVKAIRPRFDEFASQYDTKKYWPEVYQRVGQEFRQPRTVAPETLREALLWKYGHLRKPAIPPAHERLISHLQQGWPAAVAALPKTPEDAFVALDREFGGKTRFITVAFLLHLLHPSKVPIIDQHNFRAVNAIMVDVRPTWKSRRQPSQYADIMFVAAFMEAVLQEWVTRDPESAPNARELDKFLMMYGKAIKERSNKRLHLSAGAVVSGRIETTSRGRRK